MCTLSTQPLEAACQVTYDAAQPTRQRRSGLESFSDRKTSLGIAPPIGYTRCPGHSAANADLRMHRAARAPSYSYSISLP